MVNTSNQHKKSCFIIMPISDPAEYESGHFKRIYEHLIVPACESANYLSVRADDVKSANHIILDILQRIVTADLVICDLSSKNANVMYELGVRQAFNLPVVLIKDHRTDRVFDIQGLRTVEYDEKLRVDCVRNDVKNLREAIEATMQPNKHDINSLVKLLSIQQAELPNSTPVSEDTSLILASLRDISTRLSSIEQTQLNEGRLLELGSEINRRTIRRQLKTYLLPRGEEATPGDEIFDFASGASLGKLVSVEPAGVILRKIDGKQFIVPSDSDYFENLSTIPF